ncbi:unnamed protein product [Rangifer tarandus platyrhynchus]|uniref:Uncharacterized protein n=1 Tax=Rangifer tarandus platyrhynchus TaxID=3082113 RepID=A0ABN8ZWA4_RANTA|nr:unnamed protein product [Rangifer tarandus platyrhynchus]
MPPGLPAVPSPRSPRRPSTPLCSDLQRSARRAQAGWGRRRRLRHRREAPAPPESHRLRSCGGALGGDRGRRAGRKKAGSKSSGRSGPRRAPISSQARPRGPPPGTRSHGLPRLGSPTPRLPARGSRGTGARAGRWPRTRVGERVADSKHTNLHRAAPGNFPEVRRGAERMAGESPPPPSPHARS